MKAQLHQLAVLLKFVDPHFYKYLGNSLLRCFCFPVNFCCSWFECMTIYLVYHRWYCRKHAVFLLRLNSWVSSTKFVDTQGLAQFLFFSFSDQHLLSRAQPFFFGHPTFDTLPLKSSTLSGKFSVQCGRKPGITLALRQFDPSIWFFSLQQLFNQLNQKLKPMTIWLPAFPTLLAS